MKTRELATVIPLGFVLGGLVALSPLACAGGETAPSASEGGSGPVASSRLPGGETTNDLLLGTNAFKQRVSNITDEHDAAFFSGNSFFNSAWVEAPASTEGRDGLGPLFNARSCSGCHLFDGRGHPPLESDEPLVSLLFRIGTGELGAHGAPEGDPRYGDQFQPFSLPDVPLEATAKISYDIVPGSYADGETFELLKPTYELLAPGNGPFAAGLVISPRVAPVMIGLGLLEALEVEELEARADPDDRDEDGVSGRLNRVWDVEKDREMIGRFGWKAEQPSVRQQVAGAFLGDMGLTTSLFPNTSCSEEQTACLAQPSGGAPEVSDEILDRVELYSRLLAPPVRERWEDEDVLAGEKVFVALGCGSCHVPSHTTGTSNLEELSDQKIWPYTDLLLHDMGEGLSDARPSFAASGSEWRTPPLWGLGRIPEINGHDRLLHDGRARGVAEAILWHDGEAHEAREAFRRSKKTDRNNLITFVESL